MVTQIVKLNILCKIKKYISLTSNYSHINFKMKRKISLLFILAVVFTFLAGCSGNTKNSPMKVGDLLTNADSYVGKNVVVEGLCSHVCAKSGMKLFLGDGTENGPTLRVESNSTIGKFNPEAAEKKVVVQGKLVEERIDEAYCQKLEEEIRNNTLVSHGEGGAGCETEQANEGVAVGSSEMDRVNDFRARIAERKAKEGKDYLSFYHVAANSYKIL